MAKKVQMTLVGLDGNAFSLMGAFSREARRQGWSQEEIKTVLNECQSGDYDHLIQTLMENIDDNDGDCGCLDGCHDCEGFCDSEEE